MFKKHYKKFLAIMAVMAALAIIRFNQAPVFSGAVLDAFDSNASSTPVELKLIFFDVGQGDSSLIIAPNGDDILIDGGPDNSVVQKLGEYLPYSDRKIEYIILSHPHADHLDGLNEVLKRYEIGQVIMTGVSYVAADYREFLRLIEEKNIPVKIINQPQNIFIGSISLSFLEPLESYLNERSENLNNSSIVFKLVYASTSALFMGDFENDEKLASSTFDLESGILKVGHHGSINANSRNFLSAVNPNFAIVSVGRDNTFGHPHFRTLYYLQRLETQIFRTDEQGDIEFVSTGRNWRLAE